MSVSVRPAVEQDLPVLQRIEVQAAALFPANTLPATMAGPTSLAELRACLDASALWVAEDDHLGLVGFIAARTHGTSQHVLEMDVLPSMGRKGVGTKLLQHLCHTASQRGHDTVTLTTFEHLPWNAPFYARNGFAEVADCAAWPHLAAALQAERERGLEHRIAMVRDAALHPRLDRPEKQ